MSPTKPRSSTNRKAFEAVLEPLQTGMGWVVARIPFDVAAEWPVRKGLRVRGELEGIAFRTSLLADKRDGDLSNKRGGRHFLLVTKKLQAAAMVRVGVRVRIEIEPDLEEQAEAVPPGLARALREDRRLRPWFDKLGLGMRKWIARWVMEPKSAEACRNRAERAAEWLLLVLEGETETPPIVNAAFMRHPGARTGWLAMSAARRRRHLLGIFHLQGVEARERRVDMAMEDAICVAERLSRKGA